MAWRHIEYRYPNSHLFHKELLWVDKNCNIYFAFKLEDDDDWTFYAGNASHALDTGLLLTNYGTSEANAQTNYLTTTRDSNGKVITVLPSNFQAKYARLYIESGNNVSIYEWIPSTYFSAHEIVTGTLEITDQLSDAPLIEVKADSIRRLAIGKFSGDAYGLAGYDASGNKVFELSEIQNLVGGWEINQGNIRVSGELEIDAINRRIQTADFVSGVLGKGWRIDPNNAEFQNIVARGKLSSSVFEKDTLSAVGGMVVIAKADVLTEDMTALDSSELTIRGDDSFVLNEIIRIKDGTNDEWMQVTNVSSAPTYAVTRDLSEAYTPNANPIWKKGTCVTSMGVSDQGFIVLDASKPAARVYKRNSAVYNDYTEVLRFGNLNELLGYTQDIYGLAGGTDALFIKIDPIYGVRLTANIIAGQISGSEIIGATIKTASSGRRIQIDSEGLKLIATDLTGKWGSGIKWGDGTKWGSGKALSLGSRNVPLYSEGASAYGDIHYYNKVSDPTGAAEVGDTCVVNGVLKICTVGGTPGTWTVVGTQS
jgi:hypothetical protein